MTVLELPQEVDILTPVLAEPQHSYHHGGRVYAVRLRSNLEIAQFNIVRNEMCPEMGTNKFCMVSEFARLHGGEFFSSLIDVIIIKTVRVKLKC